MAGAEIFRRAAVSPVWSEDQTRFLIALEKLGPDWEKIAQCTKLDLDAVMHLRSFFAHTFAANPLFQGAHLLPLLQNKKHAGSMQQ